jgi:hypothetical protein
MLTLMLRGLLGARREKPQDNPFSSILPDGESRPGSPDLIFRLKAWPQLPEDGRTAEIYRMLSVMSNQPVNRQWLLARCRMAPRQLDKLLLRLHAEGSLEVIDPARFGGRDARVVA